jgi:phage/plasmid-like protein (TIGR03299 family)
MRRENIRAHPYAAEKLDREKEVRIMAANVENMFYVREKPWHGLGTRVEEAPGSKEALVLAGLDWRVDQEAVYTDYGEIIPGYKANVRSSDRKVLGVVTDRYKVIQNEDAFEFTDELLGKGVRYETAGSLQGGRKVWLLARLPREYVMGGDRISPYLVFSNTHDGSGAVKVAVTPIRVVCNNTLNLALSSAKRSWSMIHTGNIEEKLQEASDTLFKADEYMTALGKEFDNLRALKLGETQVKEFVETLLPLDKAAPPTVVRNIRKLREDLKARYYDAPDLAGMGNNGYRFINAVSDFATHAEPIRRTKAFNENLFGKTIEGNPMIDKAYQMLMAA